MTPSSCSRVRCQREITESAENWPSTNGTHRHGGCGWSELAVVDGQCDMLLHKSARCALQSLDSRSDRPSGEPAVHGTVAQQARSRHSLVKDPLNEDREHAGERLAERRCSLKVFLRRCDVGLVVRLKRRSEDGFLLAERPAQSRFGDPTLSSTLIQGRPSLPVMAERAHDRWHCGVKIYGSGRPAGISCLQVKELFRRAAGSPARVLLGTKSSPRSGAP